jgi:hypothetical protein
MDEPISTALVVDPALDQGGLVVDRSDVAEHMKGKPLSVWRDMFTARPIIPMHEIMAIGSLYVWH